MNGAATPISQSPHAGRIERYTFHERFCHWLAGLSYLYCLATGLAFYTPYLFWIAVALGGGPVSRFWHPVVGLMFAAAAIWMHGIWSRDISWSETDRKWLNGIRYYVTNQDENVPPQGRFNAGQKIFYWAMYYGAGLLFLSGVVMWFPEYVAPGLGWVRPLVVMVHEIAALVTIGAFIIHVYMGIFMVPGSLAAITSGYVSSDWARTHHKLWYDQASKPSDRE